jgi:hypothetical protein
MIPSCSVSDQRPVIPVVRRWEFFPISTPLLEDFISIGMNLRILLRQINFGFFSHGHEEDGHLNIFVWCYVFHNDDSNSRLPCDIDPIVRLLLPRILVFSLLTLLNYFNGCIKCVALEIWLKIKIVGEPFFVFILLKFDLYLILLWLLSEKYKIMSLENKKFKDLDYFLIYFKLYL